VIAELEFKIFHNIFCEMFQIQKKGIAFNEYMELVYEKLVLHIIEIRSFDWLIIFFIVMINLARKKLKLDYNNCVHQEDDSTTYYQCIDNNDFIAFCFIGEKNK
jgi:hypothetical protein